MGIAKFIYELGERLRNPSLRSHYAFLKKSEHWSVSDLEAYQLSKLKELISHCIDTVPYYQNIFIQSGISESSIETLDDLKKIPVLSKNQLLENVSQIHSTKSYPKEFLASTSGTTGDSLKFQREESADSFNRASIMRGYSWYGVKPWDRNGYFWGFNFDWKARLKTKLLDALQNRFRLFSYSPENLKDFSKKLRSATYVHGYSSMIYQTAKLIEERSLEPPKNLKMVKGTSEKIYDSYRDVVKRVFGVPIISEYGATESGIIAFECPHGNMHVNMEGVIVECVDHRILVTNLQLFKFPIIRYELGDYIELATKNETCSCGMKHQILKEVTGRIGETIRGFKSEYPSLYFYYIFKNLASKHDVKLTYYVEQREVGKLDFFIEEKLASSHQNLLKKEISKYFLKDIDYTINRGKKSSKNGKSKSFKSYL
ncbi:phenylacetate-CoA ligase [Pustulibacterium marinum]|uniref:Phenylacetate-CoA ligase n=1 Tax=Pustulibacterium marinum TaxID=1224947 RepID=A0A1I7HN30_9FLAO|nr:phenylacetate--CoA ligase family protein [Pustulibacterium marinum]SFU62140.1 phenylacetate-CoA ligase [Pustulibacterium marinum]